MPVREDNVEILALILIDDAVDFVEQVQMLTSQS